MPGRRGRGNSRGSPVRGNGGGRGRGKAQVGNESVEVNSASATHVSNAVEPSNSVSYKATTSEPNALNNTNINDPAESCIGNLRNADATLKTTMESTVNTEKESDVINIDADAVSLAVNIAGSTLEPSSNEPEVIELYSDDDSPSKVMEEKKQTSSNTDTEESLGLDGSANEKGGYDASDVINLDDDDDDDHDDMDDVCKTGKDEHLFYCAVCDINCKTHQIFERHRKGSYHWQRMKKANEDKTVRDEKQAVDAAATAADAETSQVEEAEDEEGMNIELSANTNETFDLAKSNNIWILVDQVEEMESTAEDESTAVAHEDSSPAEGKDESPDTVVCGSIGGNKVEVSIDLDGQIMERVYKDSDCGVDGTEGSDNTEVAAKVVTDEGNCKEADDDDLLLNKADGMAATQNEAIVGEFYTVDRERNVDGICSASSCTSKKEDADHTESKEVKEESKEHGEPDGKSDESETGEDSTEQGDAVIDPYYCTACDVRCESDKAYHMHTRGMVHTLNCGSSSSAANRPKPVPQVYRVPKTAKKKSGAKKPKEKKPAGIGTDGDAILIDDDEESDEMEEDDVEEVEDINNSKDFAWIGCVAEDSYYCDICECGMTSEHNYDAHLIGARHKKNKRNRDLGVPVKKSKGIVAIVGHQTKVVDCVPRAQEMLDSCKEALIGLQYMTEFCHSSPDVEPRYICNLCESKCDIRMVILHVTGLKHRINYLRKHHTNYAILVQQRARKSDQTPLADQFANEIEAENGRQKMVVKMDMGGDTDSGSLVKAKGKELVVRERRRSRSGSRRRDRSPHRLSSRRRSWSRSRDRHSTRDRYSKDIDYRSRWRDMRSGEREQDRDDRDWMDSSAGGRRRSDYNRNEQDSRTEQGLMSAAQAIYACGASYPYAQMAGVQYGFVSPATFRMGASYPTGLGSAYPIPQRAILAPPSPKRSRLSDASSTVSLPMSYGSPNLLGMYGALGAVAASPYASLYEARFLGPTPQPVPPVTQAPLPSKGSTGYQRSFKLPSSFATYGSKVGTCNLSSRAASSDDTFSTLSSIVASVATATRDDDEAAEMSRVIAEAVIKYKMQKVQEKNKQMPPPDKYQKRY